MDAYNRLSQLMELLMSERFRDGITIDEISSVLKIPREVLAGDMVVLTGDEHIRGSIVLSENLDVQDWRASLRKSDIRAFGVRFRVDTDLFLTGTSEDVVALYLSPFEKSLFARAVNVSRFSGPVWIKEPAFARAGEIPGITGPLQIAIEQGHPVTFAYISGNDHEKYEGFIPRSIYIDLYDKKRYLTGTDADSRFVFKKLDRIKELNVHYDENAAPLKDGGPDILDYIWGADLETDEIWDDNEAGTGNERCDMIVEGYKVRHVKIKIYKETGNIYEKIKTETNGRCFGKLYNDPEEEGVAYYEDDVCGMGSFKKWLLGYGASVMVLEPYDLAEDIYRILQRRLDRYESVSEGPSP